jgi:hypothetical protein
MRVGAWCSAYAPADARYRLPILEGCRFVGRWLFRFASRRLSRATRELQMEIPGQTQAAGSLPGAACYLLVELEAYKAAPLQDGQAIARAGSTRLTPIRPLPFSADNSGTWSLARSTSW